MPYKNIINTIFIYYNFYKTNQLLFLCFREHKVTQLLKECLGSLTCHVAMVAHVSPLAQHYTETLSTVQLAARIHRMRRRRIKVSAYDTLTYTCIVH